MSLSITCPGCDSIYTVGEVLIGKTIRCKKCSEMIPVKAAVAPKAAPAVAKAAAKPVAKATVVPAKRVVEVDDDEDDVPLAKSKPSRRRDEDDEEDDNPRRRRGAKQETKKSPLLLILGGVGALLLAGGAAAYFLIGDDKKPNDIAAIGNTDAEVQPAIGANGISSVIEAGPKPGTQMVPRTEPKVTRTPLKPSAVDSAQSTPIPKAEPVKPEVKPEPVKPEPVKPEPVKPTPPVVKPETLTSNGITRDQMMTGTMTRLTTDTVKKASVFILVDTPEGQGAGSGWFGLEPGLIFTNAHVIHMIAPYSPPPKKITVFLNSGTPEQREIPHSRIKILAVDQDIDLAVLQIINEPNLPSPLKLKPSVDLVEAQGVTTFGFPLSYILSSVSAGSKKEPEISVRRCSFTAFRRNDFGELRHLQLDGGVNQGNSGGALVDAEGDVVGIVVSLIGANRIGASISNAIPSEYAYGLLAGRVSTVEYGIPYRDKDKIRIPVTANVLDPLGRIGKINIRGWVADTSDKYRRPGTTKPDTEAGDTDEQTSQLTYDPKTKTAKGELTFPDLAAGRAYWAQPYYANAINPSYYLPGTRIKMAGPPVDRTNASLVFHNKAGAVRSVTMSNSSDITESVDGEGEGKSERAKLKTIFKLKESAGQADRNDARQAARANFAFEGIEVKVEALGGAIEQDVLPKSVQAEMNTLVKQIGAQGFIDKFGEMYRVNINALSLPDPKLQGLMIRLTSNGGEALQAASIPLPNKTVTPGETWTSSKDSRLISVAPPSPTAGPNPMGGPKPKIRELKYKDLTTYTYIGQRDRAGKKEAVVLIEGKSVQAAGAAEAVSGSIKGIAWIEIDTGIVVEAEIHKEFDIDSSSDGLKKHVTGLFDYKVSRGSAQQ